MEQLTDFIDAAIILLQDMGKEKPPVQEVDFYTHKKDLRSQFLAYFLKNPRHSSNILISPPGGPGANRIHFVDAAPVRATSDALKAVDEKIKPVTLKIQRYQLSRWKNRLLEELNKNPA